MTQLFQTTFPSILWPSFSALLQAQINTESKIRAVGAVEDPEMQKDKVSPWYGRERGQSGGHVGSGGDIKVDISLSPEFHTAGYLMSFSYMKIVFSCHFILHFFDC